MFNKTNQLQIVDVNEWVDKLLAAQDCVKAVDKIRKELDMLFAAEIDLRARNLEKQEGLYDFYYEPMPRMDDFQKFVVELIDYRLPDELAERWQQVISTYRKMKEEQP